MSERNELCGEMLRRSCLNAQLKKLKEECKELIDAIEKGKAGEIFEEVADVEIVVDVLRSRFAAAIDCARAYKLRRMSAYCASGCKTWKEFKQAGYPGFCEDKKEMLKQVEREWVAATVAARDE